MDNEKVDMNKLNEVLMEKINEALMNLDQLDPGSEEYKKQAEAINQLYSLLIQQYSFAAEEAKADERLQKAQIDRIADVIMSILETAGKVAIGGMWLKMGFKFEETGVFASTTFRNLFPKINLFR